MAHGNGSLHGGKVLGKAMVFAGRLVAVALGALLALTAAAQQAPVWIADNANAAGALPLNFVAYSTKETIAALVPATSLILNPVAESSSLGTSFEAAYVIAVAMPKRQEPAMPVANPGRPAFSTSALLIPQGYLQSETGLLFASKSADFNRRFGPEMTTRLTIAPRLEFIVSSEPMAYSTLAGGNQAGGSQTAQGDLTGGLQILLASGKGVVPTVAVSYLRLIHGGSDTSFDIGGFTNSALVMASNDLGRFHLDGNFFVNETVAGPVRRAQLGESLAVTHPLTPRLTLTGELRHFTQPFQGTDGLGVMLAPSYTLRPNLVFDAGAVRGLTATSTHWQAVAGVTYLLPRRAGRHIVR